MEDHSAVLYVYLLGRFTLEHGGPDGKRSVIEGFEPVFRRGQSAILFKLLLTHPERRVKRDLLVRAIWPGQLATAIRKSLDVTKSVLGRTLEELCGHPLLPRVSGDPPIYALAPQSLLWTDLDACEEAIHQALSTKDQAPALAHWERAYGFLQRGELLADDTTAYWYSSPLIQDRRTRLSKQRTQCVSRIADLSLECGDISRALEVLTQECEADPAHEDLIFHLMNVLARLGRYTEALTRYTQLESVLQEHNAEPREETKRLALWLRAAGTTRRFSGWSPAAIGIPVNAKPSAQAMQESVLQTSQENERPASSLPQVHYARPIDWGEAPQAKALYGRDQELTILSRWIVNEQVHLVAIIGLAGIGKTSLAVAIIEQIHTTFSTIVWRSLQNAPLFPTFLQQCIQSLSDQQQTVLPDDVDDCISLLLSYLRTERCLLVLDNLESIFQSGKRAGQYREGYEGYGRLITRIGESKHQSCLLLTSHEKPKEIALLEDTHSLVQSYSLKGLSANDGMQILRDKGLRGETDAQMALISRYAGNPLALKLVSQHIVEVFQGDIAAFLRDGEVIFRDIQDVLDQQFERLSPLEYDVLRWLASEHEAVPLHTLQENLVHPVSRKELQEALQSLRRRHLMESTDQGFVLQKVVREYLASLPTAADQDSASSTPLVVVESSPSLIPSDISSTDNMAQNHIDANLTTQLLSVIAERESSHSEIQCSLEQKLEAFRENNPDKDGEHIQRDALYIVAMNPFTSHTAANVSRLSELAMHQYAGGLTACDYLRNGSQEDVRLASSMITNYLPVLQTVVSEVPDQRKDAAELLSQAWQIKAQMSFHFQGVEQAIRDGKEALKYARESGNRTLLAMWLRWHFADLEFGIVEDLERRKQAFQTIREARSLVENEPGIPSLVQSWVYTGSAKYEGFCHMQDEMLFSLGKAEETFFASLDEKQNRIPRNVSYGHAHLLRHKAISYAYLEKQDQACKIFMEELLDCDNSFASRLPIIGRNRLGILSEFTFTTLYLPKALKDKELSIKLWKKHLEETIAWRSEIYFKEACIAYQVLKGIWSGDADVEELRDLLVHW